MKILIVGSGGREHALTWRFHQSKKVTKIFCANGNAGIASIAECIDILPTEVEKLVSFAKENAIDMTFVGGETSLALGIVDAFETNGLRIFGPNREATQLESSKVFAKDFMLRNGIPTAKYFVASSIDQAKSLLSNFGENVVIKADGLAAGKGVVVANSKADAIQAIDELESYVGKDACEQIVLEECLFGKEVSLLLFASGSSYKLMPPVRDHKRIGEGDTGPNTGGMGTFSVDNLLSVEQVEQIVSDVVEPSLLGCINEGFPFRGIMFLGLMLTNSGIKVLEYNVRFGDPETQSIMMKLDSDLVDICEAVIDGKLDDVKISWKNGASVCVVLAANCYPQNPKIGDEITGLDQIKNVVAFHAGTSKNKTGKLITSGGRVLGISTFANELQTALDLAYSEITKIHFTGMQFRKDIGKTDQI
jgi:phosphoribosylamine---glycine ligase